MKQNICIRLQESLGGIHNGKNRFRQLAELFGTLPWIALNQVSVDLEGQAKEAM